MRAVTWLLERLGTAPDLESFHAALVETGMMPAGPRFMQLEIDISNRCNLRCIMCYHSLEAFVRRPAAFLSVDAFERIADMVLPHAHTLTLALGSEPMTSPHFIPVLRAAARHHVPRTTFYTNGTLMDDDKIAAILDARVTEICVSVDGATRETYAAIRRGACLDQVIGNVRRLIAARTARRQTEPRVRFDVVMMRRNVHELPAIVELASMCGAAAINFFHMVTYEGLGTERESLAHDPALSDRWLGMALLAAERLGITVTSHPALFASQPAQAAAGGGAFAQTPYCAFPFFHVSMNSEGEVLPCPFSHGEPAYGTVSAATPLPQIWLGPRFTTLRQRILDRDPPDMCRRCSYLASRHPGDRELFAPRRN
jgi:MoaA/NifB/PqqE/SkfB family radical SAM enzyme